jgi:hypothetical protein
MGAQEEPTVARASPTAAACPTDARVSHNRELFKLAQINPMSVTTAVARRKKKRPRKRWKDGLKEGLEKGKKNLRTII